MELTNQDYNGADFGIVPEDWEFVQLNDCLDLLTDYEANGSFESIANNVNIYDTENFAWFVRATDLENRTKGKDIKYVDKETYQFLRKTKLFGDEVLITKRGEIGKVYYFKMRTEFATLAPNLYLLKLNKRVLPFYLYCFFISPIGVRLLVEKNASSTLGALYKDDIKSISFPLPTKSEQTAIATALSDTDALIENLEKLIAKKRNIKQGVMQELLKPESNWILTSVGEVATIRKGEQLNKDTLTAQGQYPVMNGGIQPSGYTDKWNQNPNTIIISEGGNSCGYVNFIKTRFWQGGHCYSVDAKIHKHFLYHLLKFHEKEIMGLRVGSGLPNIQRNRLIEFSLSIPDREKQHAIALVLDEINEVITAMENKLQKYKMVKQGMMQALLTGKIRLV